MDTSPFANGNTSLAVTTRAGHTVHVRHLTPADDDLLVELYHRLSPETRRLRFLIDPGDVPDEMMWREAHRLSDLNPLLAAALIGTLAEDDGREHAVAVCRLARDAEDPSTAEMAIVIRDDMQCQGLGTAMLDLLIQLAMVAGVQRIRAVSLAENVAVHRLVQATGLPVTTSTSRGETTQVITIG
jgi:RimJ/RimL family protein N-acetyltransferase